MNEKFMAAKQKEIEGLISRNTWKVVERSKVKTDANILNGRFVPTIKNIGTDEEFYKARYVLQGHKFMPLNDIS
jgi:hypothetical protein